MKRLLSVIAAGALALAALASCTVSITSGGQNDVTVFDEFGSEKLTVKAGDEEIEFAVDEETDEGNIFKGTLDPETVDSVVLNSDGDESIRLAYNKYVLGWKLTSLGVYPYTDGDDEPDYEQVSLPYSKTEKDIYIWKPSDYDEDEKYSVIYMTDGQNLFNSGATSTGSWGVAQSAEAMMELGGKQTIIVGIDDGSTNRDSELTPNLGTPTQESYANGTGKYFSDFVVEKVMPYVEEHYSVYTDPEHTAVCGSSSGGIECFYIGMEHPDKFGYIGALSPAFGLFDTPTWDKYLAEKDYSENAPYIYLYCGAGDSLEEWLCKGAEAMPKSLEKISYPEEKIISDFSYSDAMHNESYWRAVFPAFLEMFNREPG